MCGIVMICWIPILLLALSFLPVRIRLEAASDLYGGRMEVSIRFLLVRKQLRYQFHLLERPYAALFRVDGSGGLHPVHPKRKSGKARYRQPVFGLIRRGKTEYLKLHLVLGLRGDPSGTALLCGCVEELLNLLLSLIFPDCGPAAAVLAEPNFERDDFTGRLQCMFSVKPVKIGIELLRQTAGSGREER